MQRPGELLAIGEWTSGAFRAVACRLWELQQPWKMLGSFPPFRAGGTQMLRRVPAAVPRYIEVLHQDEP